MRTKGHQRGTSTLAALPSPGRQTYEMTKESAERDPTLHQTSILDSTLATPTERQQPKGSMSLPDTSDVVSTLVGTYANTTFSVDEHVSQRIPQLIPFPRGESLRSNMTFFRPSEFRLQMSPPLI